MSIKQSTRVMAAVFGVSGTVHLVYPRAYTALMPSWLPRHREVILGSGVAELALAAGLLHPATRRASGWGSVALLLAVYPANLKMAADSLRSDSLAFKLGAFGRLPLQAPMIKAALDATR